MAIGQLLDTRRVAGNVPWNVQRHGSGGLGQSMEQSDIVQLLFQIRRLTTDGKPPEARPARTQRPTRNRDLEVGEFADDFIGVDAFFI